MLNKYTYLIFILTYSFLVTSIKSSAQQYFNLPSYHNANNEIGIAGNNYYLTQQNNQPYTLTEIDLQDTSYRYTSFRVCNPQTGDLLFYTKKLIQDRGSNDFFDLFNIYNKDNELIDNGRFEYSLYEEGRVEYLCIVPMLNDNQKFYLFYTQQNMTQSGLYYAIIDMNLFNGKGGIAVNEKQIKVRDGYSLATVVPGNKCNYFLVTFNHNTNSRSFITYEINSDGINTSPIQQYPVRNAGLNKDFKKISLSADRYYIGLTDARQDKSIGDVGIETNVVFSYLILKFNPETGLIENNVFGSEALGKGNASFDQYVFTSNIFSPDSRYFYAAVNTADNKLRSLYRYDLINFKNFDVQQSAKDIKDSLKYKLPLEFFIYKNQLLTATSNLISTSVITTQPYNQFHSILPKGDTIYQGNVNGFKRPVPDDLNAYSIFSRPTNFTFTNTDTIQSTLLDSVFCADTFSIVLAKDSGMNFNWSNGDTGSFITVNDYGTYWVTYKGDCSYRMDSFTLYDKRKDIIVQKFDTLICEQRFPIDIINPNKADYYYWNGVMGSNQTKVYQATDSFIAAFELDNCLITDTIRIQSKGWCPCETYIPNAFTPNNDGMNDYFKPIFQGGCVPLQYQFLIYDRWGKLVYRSNKEFDKGWNGTHNENPMPAGVYFYQIEFRSLSLNEPYSEKGEVHLIR